MSDDEFSKQAGKAIQATTAGAIGLVSGPVGVVLAAGAAVKFNVFEALAARNDEALKEFRVAALEDEMIAVRDKLRALERRLLEQGKAPDRQDPLEQHAVASEFVRGVTEARTAVKKAAIVNATVAQFDPSRGSPAMRDYWLRRIRELPEAELEFVLLVAESRIGFLHQDLVELPVTPKPKGNTVQKLELQRETMVAYQTVSGLMVRAGIGALIDHGEAIFVTVDGDNTGVSPFRLRADGEVLVSFCKDD